MRDPEYTDNHNAERQRDQRVVDPDAA